VLYKIFGQLRKDLGLFCYLKADQYLHRGSHHVDHDEDCSFSVTKNDTDKPHKHVHTDAHLKDFDLFFKIYQAIHFRHLVHLKTSKNAELMPWFDITTRFNPHFVKVYLDGGFWLSSKMNQPDKALTFLRRGLKHNPRSWQIVHQMGEIYFTQKKDYARSYSYFKHANALISTQPHTILDKKRILIFLSSSAKKINKHQDNLRYEKELSGLSNR